MTKFKSTLLTTLLLISIQNQACSGDWIQLFDGKSLKDWSSRGGDASYKVEDGVLVGTTKPNTPNTFLCPKKKFADFELTFDVKCDPALNSGVQIRSIDSASSVPEGLTDKEKQKALRRVESKSLCGPQVEIASNGNAGGVWFEGVGGWLLQPKPDVAAKAYKKDDWNSYRVVAKGHRIQVWINGTKIADADETRSKMTSGYLGFQVHGIGKRTETLQVRWKNIKIREL
jgi:hypothetical protein